MAQQMKQGKKDNNKKEAKQEDVKVFNIIAAAVEERTKLIDEGQAEDYSNLFPDHEYEGEQSVSQIHYAFTADQISFVNLTKDNLESKVRGALNKDQSKYPWDILKKDLKATQELDPLIHEALQYLECDLKTQTSGSKKDRSLNKMKRHLSYMYYKDVTHGVSPEYMKALDDPDFKEAYFVQKHFVMFELGFTPLTLLAADYEDFRKARRRYHGMTEVIDFAKIRLGPLLIPDAMIRHKECIRHRRFVITQLMTIDKENYVAMKDNPTFQNFIVCMCIKHGVDPINVALHIQQHKKELKKLVNDVCLHSEIDRVLFEALCPSKKYLLRHRTDVMFEHFYAEVCEEESSKTLQHLIENVNKPEQIEDDEWDLDISDLNNGFIEIVGFTYDPKILYGIPRSEPALSYGGNPNQYHMYYRVLPKEGENTSLKHLHLHRVSMARADAHILKLNNIKFGTGDFIDGIIASKYENMKTLFSLYTSEWFSRIKTTPPVKDTHEFWKQVKENIQKEEEKNHRESGQPIRISQQRTEYESITDKNFYTTTAKNKEHAEGRKRKIAQQKKSYNIPNNKRDLKALNKGSKRKSDKYSAEELVLYDRVYMEEATEEEATKCKKSKRYQTWKNERLAILKEQDITKRKRAKLSHSQPNYEDKGNNPLVHEDDDEGKGISDDEGMGDNPDDEGMSDNPDDESNNKKSSQSENQNEVKGNDSSKPVNNPDDNGKDSSNLNGEANDVLQNLLQDGKKEEVPKLVNDDKQNKGPKMVIQSQSNKLPKDSKQIIAQVNVPESIEDVSEKEKKLPNNDEQIEEEDFEFREPSPRKNDFIELFDDQGKLQQIRPSVVKNELNNFIKSIQIEDEETKDVKGNVSKKPKQAKKKRVSIQETGGDQQKLAHKQQILPYKSPVRAPGSTNFQVDLTLKANNSQKKKVISQRKPVDQTSTSEQQHKQKRKNHETTTTFNDLKHTSSQKYPALFSNKRQVYSKEAMRQIQSEGSSEDDATDSKKGAQEDSYETYHSLNDNVDKKSDLTHSKVTKVFGASKNDLLNASTTSQNSGDRGKRITGFKDSSFLKKIYESDDNRLPPTDEIDDQEAKMATELQVETDQLSNFTEWFSYGLTKSLKKEKFMSWPDVLEFYINKADSKVSFKLFEVSFAKQNPQRLETTLLQREEVPSGNT